MHLCTAHNSTNTYYFLSITDLHKWLNWNFEKSYYIKVWGRRDCSRHLWCPFRKLKPNKSLKKRNDARNLLPIFKKFGLAKGLWDEYLKIKCLFHFQTHSLETFYCNIWACYDSSWWQYFIILEIKNWNFIIIITTFPPQAKE